MSSYKRKIVVGQAPSQKSQTQIEKSNKKLSQEKDSASFDEFFNSILTPISIISSEKSLNSIGLKRKEDKDTNNVCQPTKIRKWNLEINNVPQSFSVDTFSETSSSIGSKSYKQSRLDDYFPIRRARKARKLEVKNDLGIVQKRTFEFIKPIRKPISKMDEIQQWASEISTDYSQETTLNTSIASQQSKQHNTSRSFEMLIDEICAKPKRVTIGIQTDNSSDETIQSLNLSTLCTRCNCSIAESQLNSSVYNFRSQFQVRNVFYGDAKSIYSENHSRRLNLEKPINNLLSNTVWDFKNISPEDWLERSRVNITTVVFPKKVESIPIFVDINRIEKKSVNLDIKCYRDGNKKIYRIDKIRVQKIIKDLDGEKLINIMTQSSRNDDDLYTEAILSPLPLPASYSLVDDDDDEYFDMFSSKKLSDYESKLLNGFKKISQNKSLIIQDQNNGEVDKKCIQQMINKMIDKILDALKNDSSPYFNIRTTDEQNCTLKDGRITLKSIPECKMRKNCLKNAGSRKKFLLTMYVLRKVYTLLQTDTKITKRELYYQIKHLVNSQSQLDESLRDVTYLLNVGQWELNIISNHGLVYGDLKLVLTGGEETNCNVPGTLIPFDLEAIVEIKSNASFILIVEKESIFQKLLSEDLPNRLIVPFIMITGKGHPDYNTKLFVNKLTKIMKLPVFILVDADVHGVKIMMEYRFGCVRSAHLSEDLTVPNAKWLGVFPSEIQKLNMKTTDLTTLDKKILTNLIKSPFLVNQPEILKELKIMQKVNKKASIEGLIKNSKFLSQSYLPVKFFNQNFV